MSNRAPVSRLPLVSFVERRSRAQKIAVAALVALVAAWYVARRVAQMLLERLWLSSVTDADVWAVRTTAQVQLLVGVGLVTSVVLGSAVWFVGVVGSLAPPSPNRIVQRYHERLGPAHRWLMLGIVAFFTVRIGLAAMRKWQSWLLFRHGGDLGTTAPVAGGDLAYHLFSLPFLTGASSFLRQLLLLAIAVSAFGHVASGALRASGGQERPRRLAVAHLAVLVAALAALEALHLVFVSRRAIATNRVGTFDGPGWTERWVSRPGLLVVALLVAAVGFAAVWLARTGRWRPLAALAAVAGVAYVGVVVVAPPVAERFVVAPAEAQRQLWSIENNLVATRRAYGLDDVATRELPAATPAAASDIERIPLFATGPMAPALQVLAGTTATRIGDVDLNRYEVDGEVVPVFTAARSASRPDLPERGWVQEHLVYTHGDGVVAVPADSTTDDGRPDVTSLDGAFGVEHEPLYFGEGLDGWYAIVGTRRAQLAGSEFEGTGIDVASLGRRLILALAVGESQPVLTSELTDESVLLYRRSVRERVHGLAPFLAVDGDPYPVMVDGRVVWIVDAYTTSSTYPASQFTTAAGVPPSSDLAGRSFNYLHAAVKVTVDAGSGETHLYRTDDGDDPDPILDTWAGIFPDLFEPIESIDPELVGLLRYPDDLWAVQTNLVGRYHVDTAEQLFNGTGRWAVSAAAATSVGDASPGAAPVVDEFVPYATTDDGFATVRPLGPGSSTNPTSTRDELAAVAVADHALDGGVRLLVPSSDGPPLLSPQVAQSAIDADPDLARTITLLNANGSSVTFGPMTPVLVESDLVWVRPIIVKGTGSSAAPRLYGVAAVLDGEVSVQPTAPEAVAGLTGT